VSRVWCHVLADSNAAETHAIVAALRAAGIDITSPEAGALSGGPGILLFQRPTEHVSDAVHELTQGGRERLVAIATKASALPNDQAWRLICAGASDTFAWTDSITTPKAVAARLERWAEVDRIATSQDVQHQLVGRSPEWMQTLRQIVEAACFTDAPVLLSGESGTGKELAARLLHSLDRRPGKREFVVLDCSTLVPELSGSEFFGHERGAFTGAVTPREGAFALADGGTLFLDEVGELPPELQMQLLRVAQEHTYKRVGGNSWKRADFRLICATNRDLQAEVAAGRFRADLYYRIAGVCCRLPALRERIADVPVLAQHFIDELKGSVEVSGIDDLVLHWLVSREFRGNVRELRVLVMRMLYRHAGPGPLSIGDIPEDERPNAASDIGEWRDGAFQNAIARAVASGIGLKDIGRAAEDIAEQIALEQENGNLRLAATRLGVTDRALQLRRAARRDRNCQPEILRDRAMSA
jgi:transcriptional regulator with GAF, ATPase, and Fis domain